MTDYNLFVSYSWLWLNLTEDVETGIKNIKHETQLKSCNLKIRWTGKPNYIINLLLHMITVFPSFSLVSQPKMLENAMLYWF